jgi:hypothetical protein
MTPEKLRAWLNRSREGAVTLRLSHCTIEEEVMFRQWRLEQFETGDIPVQVVLDTCADHADACEEEIRVAIEFLNSDGDVTARTQHKARPLQAGSFDALNAGSVTGNALVAQLLRHIEVQQRVMSTSYMNIQESYERTIAGLHKDRERMSQQIITLMDSLREQHLGGDDEEATPEGRTEALARAEAWNKVAEFAPAAMSLVIQGVQSKLNGHGAAYEPPQQTGTDG